MARRQSVAVLWLSNDRFVGSCLVFVVEAHDWHAFAERIQLGGALSQKLGCRVEFAHPSSGLYRRMLQATKEK